MFQHILLPIDGSTISEKAARSGVRLAKAFGARVTAFYMKPAADGFTAIMDGFEKTHEDYAQEAEGRSQTVLAYVSRTAKAAGVACDVVSATGHQSRQGPEMRSRRDGLARTAWHRSGIDGQ
jgi:nucleotide-binding universal stress UspA family protein